MKDVWCRYKEASQVVCLSFRTALPLLETRASRRRMSFINLEMSSYIPARVPLRFLYQLCVVCPDFLTILPGAFPLSESHVLASVKSLSLNIATHITFIPMMSRTVRYIQHIKRWWNRNTEPESVHLPNMYACKSQAELLRDETLKQVMLSPPTVLPCCVAEVPRFYERGMGGGFD